MAQLFSKDTDRQFFATVSRLVYCNPFTAERVRLEREAVGESYDEPSIAWNLDPRTDQRHQNVERLLADIQTRLEQARAGYLRGAGSRVEREFYADGVFFLVYHQLDEALDQLIAQAHREGVGRRRVTVYSAYLEAYTNWLGEERPIEPAHLFACFYQIRRAFHHIFRFFIGRSLAATQLRARIWQSIFTHDLGRYQRALTGRMAQIPTLITGPSGSGKEVVARAVGLSQFVPFDERERVFAEDFTQGFFPVNLSALSPTLIESELFGHRRGAFTGALQDREGYFAACGRYGTVFLDEIGETDLSIQVKLLRVLQTREFQRLGDVRTEAFHGKIVAATNRDLVQAIGEGKFREDFYYRLRADTIPTPDLASLVAGDVDELRFLANHVATREAGEGESRELLRFFEQWQKAHPQYRWPGNFRELEQAIRSLLVHGTYEPSVTATVGSTLAAQLASTGWTLKELTTEYVTELYRRTPNYEEVARQLEVDRRTVKKYLDEEAL
jgi:hypothetical protein